MSEGEVGPRPAQGADTDIVIIGGGLTGMVLGRALADAGYRCTLLEARSPRETTTTETPLAMSRGSQQILAAYGAWPRIAAHATPIRVVHISDRGQFGSTRLRAEELGVEALGYVVPAERLATGLRRHVDGNRACTVHYGVRIESAEWRRDRICLHHTGTDGHGTLTARLAVAADGAYSVLRDQVGFPLRHHDYRQTAVATVIETERSAAGHAFERFTRSGPLALLPFGGQRFGVIWTQWTDQVDDLLALDEARFRRALQAVAGYRLGRIRQIGPRHTYPLRLVEATGLVRPRLAVVGNAAHTLHPVAGQGFNLTLRDVAELTRLLTEARAVDADPGSMTRLSRYATRRRRDQWLTVTATDTLARVFPPSTLGPLRSAGLVGLDLLPPVRRQIARVGMGRPTAAGG